MLLEENMKILMIGDSVTDCNRRSETTAYLGDAYPHLVASKLPFLVPAIQHSASGMFTYSQKFCIS
jgi:hypothetical protein